MHQRKKNQLQSLFIKKHFSVFGECRIKFGVFEWDSSERMEPLQCAVSVCFSVCAADCDEAIVHCNPINTELLTS